MRETLLDALASGPPYYVKSWHNVPSLSQTQLLTELIRRGLITSDPYPTLTEAGIAEAAWFRDHQPKQNNGPQSSRRQKRGSNQSP